MQSPICNASVNQLYARVTIRVCFNTVYVFMRVSYVCSTWKGVRVGERRVEGGVASAREQSDPRFVRRKCGYTVIRQFPRWRKWRSLITESTGEGRATRWNVKSVTNVTWTELSGPGHYASPCRGPRTKTDPRIHNWFGKNRCLIRAGRVTRV